MLGADLALEHPLLSYQIRANYRHHQAHVYVVTPGRCAKTSTPPRVGARRAITNRCARNSPKSRSW